MNEEMNAVTNYETDNEEFFTNDEDVSTSNGKIGNIVIVGSIIAGATTAVVCVAKKIYKKFTDTPWSKKTRHGRITYIPDSVVNADVSNSEEFFDTEE